MAQVRIIEAKSRRFRCDISGCRNMTRYLITKRNDVSARPIHLCADCIEGIYKEYQRFQNTFFDGDGGQETTTPAPVPQTVTEPEPKPEKTKTEPKPNKANKQGGKGKAK